MDSFPEDLLVGVFPLVFAINATQPNEASGNNNNNSEEQNSPRRGSRFDKFLDVMVASLLDADGGDASTVGDGSQDGGDRRRSAHGVSLFRPDDDEDDGDYSSDEEYILEDVDAALRSHYNMNHHHHQFRQHKSPQQQQQQHHRQGSFSYTGFGRRSITSRAESAGSQSGSLLLGNPASYAKALSAGQAFFERARIESYGTRHGFPPSKDADGSRNLVHSVPTAMHTNNPQVLRPFFFSSHDNNNNNTPNHPLSGILPAGWLEKHVHALPSILLVVCTITNTTAEQEPHNRFLFETIEHLAHSLAPKRQCKIHIVGLMEDEVTEPQAQDWCEAILDQLLATEDATRNNNNNSNRNRNNNNNTDIHDAVRVTLLRASGDLDSIDAGLPPSPALKRLHEQVREASLSYYLGEARRTKDKLAKLCTTCNPNGSAAASDNPNATTNNARRNHDSSSKPRTGPPPDPILPLVIRYCVKIAFFYEFQWKHEKSLRFLAEAYRHACRYYHYLQQQQLLLLQQQQQQQQEASQQSTTDSPKRPQQQQQDNSNNNASAPSHHLANVGSEGVEVELSATATDAANASRMTAALWNAVVPTLSPDMIHQCRAVAEWINLKLLSAGFTSHTESGYLAACQQWRDHQRIFCSPTMLQQTSSLSSSSSPQSADLLPQWLEWSFVARQRLVFCQLVERHSLSACHDLDEDNEELFATCSPWRTSLAAAEGLLRLAREVDRVKHTATTTPKIDESFDHNHEDGRLRNPFIGALDSGGLLPLLKDEGKVPHREQALQLVLKTITLYESELRREKRGFYAEDSFHESSSSRSGARMFYLAGGILLGMNRHEEAMPHLEKATKYAKGWRELELAIRKMLIECYEKHVPSHSDPMANESSQALASMILDSYFNAEMSSQDLRRALGQFSTISGGGSLKWYRESFNDEDPDLPFTFEVTFPENIFATIGDTVKATILIKSNLDYAVHINSVVLLSLAGELPISSNDLMRATNASEGSDGGIIIQRKFEIHIETELVLPKDLSIIASDDSGNGGELQGVAGRGSFSKSARPRSAGLTSAGGARLLSADQLSRENKVTQGWSLRFLGGKPLKCDGLRVAFYPVQVQAGAGASGAGDQVPVIELTIDKKKPRTAADIRRTPFEEENYIASAWSRPQSLPFSRGPRSLRVLGPQPQMVITNITENPTDGKALEGTVNRMLLKLQAGPTEHCADISFRVSCFSVLLATDGTTKRLVSEQNLSSEAETSVDMKNAKYRTPVLVLEEAVSSGKARETDYGYALPQGWELAESGQDFDGKLRVLKGGDATYIQLDFFRPSPTLQTGEAEVINSSVCKTDYYVTVSYRKERPSSAGKRRSAVRGGRGSRGGGRGSQGRGRGRGDRRSFASAASSEEFSAEPSTAEFSVDDVVKTTAPDDVSLEYSGTIVWSRPLLASFGPGVMTEQRCGIPHSTNVVRPPSSDVLVNNSNSGNAEPDFLVPEGGRVAARCTLNTPNVSEELRAEIVGVRFHENDPESALKVRLEESLQSLGDSHLYKASIDDICRIITAGSKFSVAYSVQVNLDEDAGSDDEDEETPEFGPLGAVQVDWRPFPLPLPPDANIRSGMKRASGHGPLRLEKPCSIRFQGPPCHVQRSPFRAKVDIVPSSPSVASPFEVNYTIENLTSLHQTLLVNMTDPMKDGSGGVGGDSSGLLFSGLTNGRLILGPKERQVVSFTVLATRPGNAMLPPLSISSNRHNTWVVHETAANQFPLYIFP